MQKGYQKGVCRMSTDEFTQENRKKCETRLHRRLAWVGVQYPEDLDMPCGRIRLRNYIFDLCTKTRLSKRNLKDMETLRRSLMEMKRMKEKELETMKLTLSEGKELCHEIAGLIRAIDTLKDMPKKKGKAGLKQEIKDIRIKDEQRWIKYLKQIKK